MCLDGHGRTAVNATLSHSTVLAVQIDAGGILVCMNNIELKPTSHISTGKSALGYEICPRVNVNY